MSLIKKLAGETIIYGISSILPRVLHYTVFTIYLTHKFTLQKDFGIYKDLYAYATILLVLMIFRMDTALFRFGSREHSVSKAFGTAIIMLLVSIFIGLVLMYGFADPIANYLKYPGQSYYVKWFAFILAFDALAALPFARYRLENKAKRFMYLKLFNTFITVVLVLFFIEICPILSERGFDFADKIYSADRKLDYVFISNLIASGLIFLLVLPELIKTKIQWDPVLLKKMLLYASPLVVVGIAGNINSAFAAPLQKYFLGNDILQNLTEAGKYAVPASLAIFLNLFTTAFNYAAEPFFFKQHKLSVRTDLFGKVALLYTIFALMVMLMIVLYVDLILLMMGAAYRSATEIVPILLFANVFLGLYYNFSIWYKLDDKTYVGALISIGGAVITLILSIILLPRIGYIASAWAALACFSFMSICGYLAGQYFYPIKYPIIKILRQIIIAFVLIYIADLVKQSELGDFGRYGINTVLFIGYMLISYLFEKDTLMELFAARTAKKIQ